MNSSPLGAVSGSPEHRILVCGPMEDLAGWIENRFHGLTSASAVSAQDAAGVLDRERWSLLVLDQRIGTGEVEDFLRRIRSSHPLPRLPVIVCVERGVHHAYVQTLVEQLGVEQLLFHPLDREELAHQIGRILGVSVPPTPGASRHAQADVLETVRSLRERFRETTFRRIDALEEATVRLLEGTLDAAGQRAAEREAHRIAGSTGTFGFAQASRRAREVELIFGGTAPLGRSHAVRLADLLADLRGDLESDPPPSFPEEDGAGGGALPMLLAMTRDPALIEPLAKEAAARGYRVEVVPEAALVRERMRRIRPAVLVLDLSGGEATEEAYRLMDEVDRNPVPPPVLVMAESGALTDRVEAARHGSSAFLKKPVSAPEVFDLVSRLVDAVKEEHVSVLVVDDDAEVLTALRALLEPRGLAVRGIQEPLRFWSVLEETAPNLLILDVDMPHLSGIELCRVVRNAPHWIGLPILFLTARTDSETVRRIFAAGADDYVAKPLVPPELLARITTRLERVRFHRRMAEVDHLTGVATRRKSEEVLEKYLRLGQRQGQPVSLAVLDLDHFKRINDRYGHTTGDLVLRHLGQLLLRMFRSEDVTSRWGGEEFVLGMYGMGADDALRRIVGARDALRAESFRAPDGSTFKVGVSAGVASFPEDGTDLGTLFRAADQALYQAKAQGRGRVLAAERPSAESSASEHVQVDVVLVEDDEALGTLLQHVLGARGYTIKWLQDGASAVEALKGENPRVRARVILLDIDLPVLDGLAALRRLAADGVTRHTRVLMLSLRSGEADIVKALELGASDHISKPFSVPVLLQRIRRAMEA